MALRGRGGFPFDTPDRTGDWWGAQSCPRAVLIVADDTAADALAAASLSDPTNRSSEPRLARVAAADPLFDPIGGFDHVDTDGAPIIVTRSGRRGATELSPTAAIAATDLAKGGCTTAREAVLVGGPAAVPSGVGAQLVRIGYQEVFRASGDDRYATAANVATALGTGTSTSASCTDGNAADGTVTNGFHGNAAPEFRFDASTCRVLSRSVVLADGGTGADALAAGWWTSFWQVPILLVAPDGSLPQATRTALQTLAIDNVIVLGGTGRVPEATAQLAAQLATAAVGRISGTDRYGTSIAMARAFGGWFPTGDADFAGDLVCIAGSSGSSANSAGWPDALAAGPFCGRLAGGAADVRAPKRALPPVEGAFALAHPTGAAATRRHSAVPVLLVPTRSVSVEVLDYLGALFPSDATWCTSLVEGSCSEPGFAVVVGGTASVSSFSERQIARVVSGDRYRVVGDTDPHLATGWWTKLSMAPVFDDGTPAGSPRACWSRDALSDVRWVWSRPSAASVPTTSLDAVIRGAYLADADGIARSTGKSRPLCIGIADAVSLEVGGTSLSGTVTPAQRVDAAAARRVRLRTSIDETGTATGPPGVGTDEDTTWHFGELAHFVGIDAGSRSETVTGASLDLRLSRAPTPSFAGDLTLFTDSGTVRATVAGAAVVANASWELRGAAVFSGGTWLTGPGGGGFAATIDTADGSTATWSFDGLTR